MTGILARLAHNSEMAIADGVYDVDLERKNSGRDMADIIRANLHANIISEIKFSSPSRGRIRTASDPGMVAKTMVGAGARAISVLTQPHLFGGSPEYFVRVRDAVDVPLLMKDVIIDRVQVDAGKKMGADYVLLIQSLYDAGRPGGLDEMIGYVHRNGMRVLLEAHTEPELRRAAATDADLIGINNRNLDTLEMDMGTTCRLLKRVTPDVPVVSESGISTADHIRELRACGADAFLVGSHIMKSSNIGEAVRDLVTAY